VETIGIKWSYALTRCMPNNDDDDDDDVTTNYCSRSQQTQTKSCRPNNYANKVVQKCTQYQYPTSQSC